MLKHTVDIDFEILSREVCSHIAQKSKPQSCVDELCQRINSSMSEIETDFRALYSGTLQLMEDPHGELDRHRQGACIIIAFINRLELSAELELHRERIAVYAGFKVMCAILMAEAKKDNKDAVAKIKDGLTVNYMDAIKGFKYPDLICDERTNSYDDYEKGLLLGLRKTFTGLRKIYEMVDLSKCPPDFDSYGIFMVPQIANILFLLESYTRKCAGSFTGTSKK